MKFNVDMSGYYMVHYQGDGWSAIINLLQHNHTVLTSNDRASLVHDVFQLVRSVRRSSRTSPNGKFPPLRPSLLCLVAAWGRWGWTRRWNCPCICPERRRPWL